MLEYKRFKDTATLLGRQQERHENRFPRYPAKGGAGDGGEEDLPPVDLDEVQVWDLLSAFSRLMQEVGVRKPRFHEVTYDDTPLDLHAADIEDRIKREGTVTLRQLVAGRKSRSEMIGVFLALLELIRQKKVVVSQGEDLGEVEIGPASEEHRRTYEQTYEQSPPAPDDATRASAGGEAGSPPEPPETEDVRTGSSEVAEPGAAG